MCRKNDKITFQICSPVFRNRGLLFLCFYEHDPKQGGIGEAKRPKVVFDGCLWLCSLFHFLMDACGSFHFFFFVDGCLRPFSPFSFFDGRLRSFSLFLFFDGWVRPFSLFSKVVQISIWQAHFDHKWCFTLIPANRFAPRPYFCNFY